MQVCKYQIVPFLTKAVIFLSCRALRVRKKMTAPGDDIAIIGDILCENVSVYSLLGKTLKTAFLRTKRD